MSNSRILNDDEEKKLDAWLSTERIELNSRTCREFTDVMKMAKLFRRLDSKLVDAHSYMSHSSLALKIHNWENFNLLVLRKLGLTVSRNVLEELAAGRLNAIKFLLFQLMSAEHYQAKHTVRMPQTNPLDEHQELRREAEKRNDCIREKLERIRDLEGLAVQRDKQISDLLRQLADVYVRLLTLNITLRYKNQHKERKEALMILTM